MDQEKYPNYFLAIIVLYIVILLISLAYFIIPSLSFALGYLDYYVISLLFLLPLILLAVYYKSSRFEFLWGKEGLIRSVITALAVVDFLFVLYMMILLI